MQKARRQPLPAEAGARLRLLVGTWFQVLFHSPSGVLFTFPSRYWCTIGSRRIFSLRRWSSWLPARFLVSRGTRELRWEVENFRLRGSHPLWRDFPDASTSVRLCNSLGRRRPPLALPTTPAAQRPSALTCNRFRLFPVRSPLLGKSFLLSFPEGTEMFQFPSYASRRLCIQQRDAAGLPAAGFPIRKSPDQCLFAAPRGLSQLTTSFIARRLQGIHHAPLVT
jgi:hypothetical protein